VGGEEVLDMLSGWCRGSGGRPGRSMDTIDTRLSTAHVALVIDMDSMHERF